MGFSYDFDNGLDEVDFAEMVAEEEAIKDKVKKEVSKFNHNDDKVMDVLFLRAGYVSLHR